MNDLRAVAAALLSLAACATSSPSPAPGTAPPADKAAAAPAQPPAARVEPSNAPTERTPAELKRDEELSARAAAIVDAFQNDRVPEFAGQLTNDGKRLVFGSNRDGSPQLYLGEVGSPAAPPTPLTVGPERVRTARLTRDGRAVLFTRDRGADENSHVYRVALDGSAPVDLTPGEGVRFDPPAVPLRPSHVMVLGRRTVKSPASTILVGSIDRGEPRALYQDPAPAFAADVAPDGSRALVVRVLSPSETVLLEISLAHGGAARRLWPAEGRKEAIATAAYAADGRRAYVATDQGGETFALLAIDTASRKVTARFTPHPATAQVDAVAVSPRGDVVAARVYAGDRNEFRLLDARTLAPRRAVQLPLGTGNLGDFTPDGRTLTVSLSTPDRPGEPFAVDVASGKVRALRDDRRPGRAAIAPVDTWAGSIPAFDGKAIPIHTYLPRARGDRRLPVIVEFHGGPAASATIGWKPRAQFFLAQGYAWVEPNVRGSTGFGRAWEMADNREKRGDVLKDMESVNAWVKAQPWADPDRVVIFGGSYGGWVVLMGLSRQPQLWAAGIDLVGVADLRTLLRSTDQAIRAIFVDEFGDLEKDQDLLARWSPLPGAGRIVKPLFVYQGANDPRVPREESDAIVEALRDRDVPVEYMIAPDEGHSIDRRHNQIELFARAARFLEEHLGAAAGAAPAAR